MTKYAETLLNILELKGMRKSDLVNNLKIPDSTVRSWWTKDSIPSFDMGYRIAKYLGVSMEYLLTGEVDTKNSEKAQISKLEWKIERLSLAQRKVVESVVDSYLGEDAKETTA